MNIIKYLAVLLILFFLGLVLLGAFNPNMEAEMEEKVIASVRKTWDVFVDSSSWDTWKLNGSELKWIEGRKANIGTTYEIISSEGDNRFTETVVEANTDSLLVLQAEYENGQIRRSEITFSIGNGMTIISEKQTWSAPGFIQNVKLNFNKSAIVKSREKELERFKVMLEDEGPDED